MTTALRTRQVGQTIAYQVFSGEYRTPQREDAYGYLTGFSICRERGGERGGMGWQVYFGQPARWLTGDDRFFRTLTEAVSYCDAAIARDKAEMARRSA
jgi:hypothetical protein